MEKCYEGNSLSISGNKVYIFLIMLFSCMLFGWSRNFVIAEEAKPGLMNFHLNYEEDVWRFTDVDVGPPKGTIGGYKYVNFTYPSQVKFNFVLPTGWKKIEVESVGGETTTLQIVITDQAKQGSSAQLKAFFDEDSTYFSLVDPNEYPPKGIPCTTMLSSIPLVRWIDKDNYVHYYEYVASKNIWWTTAYNEARKRVLEGSEGLHGYLATITSIEEQHFIYNSIATDPGWLGGTRATMKKGAKVTEEDGTIKQALADLTKINTMAAYNSSSKIFDTTTINDYCNAYDTHYNTSTLWYWADGAEDPRNPSDFSERGMGFYDRKNNPVKIPGTDSTAFNYFSNSTTYNTYKNDQKIINNGSEPNNTGYGFIGTTYKYYEAYLQFAQEGKASWNDLPMNSGNTGVNGYYVEYAGRPYQVGGGGSGIFIDEQTTTSEEFPIPYMAEFVVQNSGYTDSSGPKISKQGKIIKEPTQLVKNATYLQYGNKRFLGWSETQDGSSGLYDFTQNEGVLEKDITLYGQWAPCYLLHFEPNNQHFTANRGEIQDESVWDGGYVQRPVSPALVINKIYPEYGNEKFLGWYLVDPNDGSELLFDFSKPFAFNDPTIMSMVENETLTLQGRWEEYFTVDFNVGNSSYSGELILPQNIAKNSFASIPLQLEKNIIYSSFGNQRFSGWYDGEVEYDFDGTPVTQDKTLTGKWEQYYKVTFVNLLDNVIPSQNVVKNGQATVPGEMLTDDKYEFAGWSSSPTSVATEDGEGNLTFNDPFDFSKPIVEDTVVYGVWYPAVYSYVFDPNGGIWSQNKSSDCVVHEYIPSIDTPENKFSVSRDVPQAPTKIGYTFKGWSTNKETPLELVDSEVTRSFVYYAVWELNRYNISYDLLGNLSGVDGTGITVESGNSTEYTVESSYPVEIEKIPTWTGHVFSGWTMSNDLTSEDGLQEGGVLHTDEPMIPVRIPQGTVGDVTVYANWETIDYSIHYDLAGGENPPENRETYSTDDDTFTISPPTRNGYRFLGWTATGGLSVSEAEMDADMEVQIQHNSVGDIVFTAHWERIDYQITYSLSDDNSVFQATLPSNNPNEYSIESHFPLVIDDTIRTGYQFLGWTSNGGVSLKNPTFSPTITEHEKGDIHFTANWQLFHFPIVYKLDGGTVQGFNPTSYSVEDAYPLQITNPTKENYAFLGWTMSGARHIAENTKKMVLELSKDDDGTYSLGEITLEAHWLYAPTIPTSPDTPNPPTDGSGGSELTPDVPSIPDGNSNGGSTSGASDDTDNGGTTSDGKDGTSNGGSSNNGTDGLSNGETSNNGVGSSTNNARDGSTNNNKDKDTIEGNADFIPLTNEYSISNLDSSGGGKESASNLLESSKPDSSDTPLSRTFEENPHGSVISDDDEKAVASGNEVNNQSKQYWSVLNLILSIIGVILLFLLLSSMKHKDKEEEAMLQTSGGNDIKEEELEKENIQKSSQEKKRNRLLLIETFLVVFKCILFLFFEDMMRTPILLDSLTPIFILFAIAEALLYLLWKREDKDQHSKNNNFWSRNVEASKI